MKRENITWIYTADSYKEKLLAMASGEGDGLGHPMGYLPIKPMLGENTTFLSRQEICRSICRKIFDRAFVEELERDCIVPGR